jgi:hypothetical protein
VDVTIPDFGTILIWVGGLTAILTLVFSLHRLSSMMGEARARRAHVREALASAETQRQGGHYAAAWETLEEAARVAPRRTDVRTARAALAMEWLRRIRIRSGEQTFTEIVRRLQPVLVRAAAASGRRRRADAIAHLGWADFLLWRDGDRQLEPDAAYQRALDADPSNPYAHAMQAHWTIWRGGPIVGARRQFADALASGRAREAVRALQLSAYRGSSDEAAVQELFRVATDMRRHGERLDDDMRRRIADAYVWHAGPGRMAVRMGRLLEPVDSADEDRQTLEWLYEGRSLQDADAQLRDFCLAALDEAAGHTARASAGYQALATSLPLSSNLRPALDAALGRLAEVHPQGGI